MKKVIASPFLLDDAPITAHAKKVVQEICDKENAEPFSPAAGEDAMDPERMRRVGLTYDEILTQPAKVKETLTEERENILKAAKDLAQYDINKIFMTGCGDSIASLQGAKFLLETILKMPCTDVQALDFAYYGQNTVDDKSLVILLSSSGKTLRTLETMYMSQEKGAKTLALTNTKGSILDEECTEGLMIHATRGGWPTQSSTAAMALVMQFGIFLAREKGTCDPKILDAYQSELDHIDELMTKVTKSCEETIKQIADDNVDRSMYLYTGAGPCYSAGFFGAAKIKEATPNYALMIPLEEFHHYNSIKEDDPIFILAPTGPSTSRAKETIEVSKYFGGKAYIVTTEGEDELESLATKAIMIPPMTEAFAGLVYSIPVQMFGYYVSMAKYNKAKKERGL